TFISLFGKELQLFEHKNMLGAYFYVSFATQKREIISEGTQRALKPLVVLLTLSTQSKRSGKL
ncbi:MAG: hypothetical protein WC149_06460, partial [Arcobacteraceae bacterium]